MKLCVIRLPDHLLDHWVLEHLHCGCRIHTTHAALALEAPFWICILYGHHQPDDKVADEHDSTTAKARQ